MVRTTSAIYELHEYKDENGDTRYKSVMKKRSKIEEYIDEMFSYLYDAGDKATYKGKIYDIYTLNEAYLNLWDDYEEKIWKIIPRHYMANDRYDPTDVRNNAAIALIFLNRDEFGLRKATEKALKLVEDSKEGERRLQIQAKIDRVNKQRAGTLKGFKTATYGRKKHRDNITQLENSVRKMW